MDAPDLQTPFQQIDLANNSAIANTGDSTVYNIEGNYYQYTTPILWKPPLMRPPTSQSFVGREDDIAWLLQQLIDESTVAIALCGPGGIGKTALVAEAVKRLVDQEEWLHYFPDGIFYHSFHTSPSLPVVFEELAHIFGEEAGNDPHLVARSAVSRRRALLIFDGVEVLADTRSLRELGGRNVVLMLSRRRSDAQDQAHRRDPAMLSAEEAITLLQGLAGPRATNRQHIEQLVASIGGYPLALQLIGNYLSSCEEELGDYLSRFKHKGLAALHFGEHPGQSVPMLLQQTYNLLTDLEQQVFALLGLLAPALFPVELIQAILVEPEHDIQQALNALVNQSVLHRPGLNYEISHPLIHLFAKEYLLSQAPATSSSSATTVNIWRERFLNILTLQFGKNTSYDPATLTLWQPHIRLLLSTIKLTDQQRQTLSHLLNKGDSGAKAKGK